MNSLTLLGTASIQGYIFRSNRLRENIGASWLVAQALDSWWEYKDPACTVIYVGGGNAALRFNNRTIAEDAIWRWSLEWLDRAPGLQFAVAHVDYPEDSPEQTFETAKKQLIQHENRPPWGREPGALPVVRACASTNLAATTRKIDNWVSAETAAKWNIVDSANDAMRSRYSDCLSAVHRRYEFPEELEKLGIEEGASQIAIVHADGNGMGELMRNAGHGIARAGEYNQALADCSARIKDLAFDAFHATLRELTSSLEYFESEKILRENNPFYPVRPIVDGGDDLTFVCHGSLGLHLAARYLRNFERLSAERFPLEGGLTACAGVVIMPQKFPFARGYSLAEQLVTRAKKARHEAGRQGSWIDFQILMEGADPSLDEFRRSQYQRARGRGNQNLLRRPYRIGSQEQNGWESFEALSRKFRSWPRSRVKALLEALVKGPDATAQVMDEFASRGWTLPLPGWDYDGKTSLFDPLEAFDFHPVWPVSPEAKPSEAVQA
jgi:hypothetical protein